MGRNFECGWEWDASAVTPTFLLSLGRVVKEEISDDNARLPCFNGRVVSWVRGPGSEAQSLRHCQAPPRLSLCLPALGCWKCWLFACVPVWRASQWNPSAFSFWSL